VVDLSDVDRKTRGNAINENGQTRAMGEDGNSPWIGEKSNYQNFFLLPPLKKGGIRGFFEVT
jgi:hypothetical protein